MQVSFTVRSPSRWGEPYQTRKSAQLSINAHTFQLTFPASLLPPLILTAVVAFAAAEAASAVADWPAGASLSTRSAVHPSQSSADQRSREPFRSSRRPSVRVRHSSRPPSLALQLAVHHLLPIAAARLLVPPRRTASRQLAACLPPASSVAEDSDVTGGVASTAVGATAGAGAASQPVPSRRLLPRRGGRTNAVRHGVGRVLLSGGYHLLLESSATALPQVRQNVSLLMHSSILYSSTLSNTAAFIDGHASAQTQRTSSSEVDDSFATPIAVVCILRSCGLIVR